MTVSFPPYYSVVIVKKGWDRGKAKKKQMPKYPFPLWKLI